MGWADSNNSGYLLNNLPCTGSVLNAYLIVCQLSLTVVLPARIDHLHFMIPKKGLGGASVTYPCARR